MNVLDSGIQKPSQSMCNPCAVVILLHGNSNYALYRPYILVKDHFGTNAKLSTSLNTSQTLINSQAFVLTRQGFCAN